MRRLFAGIIPHEVTIYDLAALSPLIAAPDEKVSGLYLGEDLTGRPFTFDPFELYHRGVLTSPNQLIVGQIGRGKSSLVKAMVLRHLAIGRSAFILDPKGEYAALARPLNGKVIKLQVGGCQVLNPMVPHMASDEDRSLNLHLLGSIAASTLGRPVLPLERLALESALDSAHCSHVAMTVRRVVEFLFKNKGEAHNTLGMTGQEILQGSRDLSLELRRLVEGDLKGMVDGQDSLDLENLNLVVVDLSALYDSAALGVVMVCVMAWMQQMLAARHRQGKQGVLVVDEAWALLKDLACARWMQRAWKLSRAWGISNIAVLHRISDLVAVGEEGSEQRALAQALLRETETRSIFAQSSRELSEIGDQLHLSEIERELVVNLPKGSALWHIGTKRSVVSHRVGSREWDLIDTDQALR